MVDDVFHDADVLMIVVFLSYQNETRPAWAGFKTAEVGYVSFD